MTTTHDNSEFPHRWTEEIWERRNVDAVDDLVAPDFVGHSPGLPEPIEGREHVREFVEMIHAAFPDFEVTVEDVVATGDRVAVRHTMTGTHEGTFLGIEQTGAEIEFAHVGFQRFEDGRLAEEWEMADHMTLFEQMGVVDPPGKNH